MIPVDFTPAVRALILARDMGRCCWCGRFFGDALNIHHRRLRSQGGRGNPANGIALCGSGTVGCHGKVHASPLKAVQRGHIVRSVFDPADVPVLTWRGLLLLDDDGAASLVSDSGS